METAEAYTESASAEARGESACYLAWAQGVAADLELLGLLAELPEPKRQPNLLFAAARYTAIAPGPFADFRTALLASSCISPRRQDHARSDGQTADHAERSWPVNEPFADR